MIIAGGFSFIDLLAGSLTTSKILISLLFFGIIGLGSDIINIPFSAIDTFVIEKKYGVQ